MVLQHPAKQDEVEKKERGRRENRITSVRCRRAGSKGDEELIGSKVKRMTSRYHCRKGGVDGGRGRGKGVGKQGEGRKAIEEVLTGVTIDELLESPLKEGFAEEGLEGDE